MCGDVAALIISKVGCRWMSRCRGMNSFVILERMICHRCSVPVGHQSLVMISFTTISTKKWKEGSSIWFNLQTLPFSQKKFSIEGFLWPFSPFLTFRLHQDTNHQNLGVKPIHLGISCGPTCEANKIPPFAFGG